MGRFMATTSDSDSPDRDGTDLRLQSFEMDVRSSLERDHRRRQWDQYYIHPNIVTLEPTTATEKRLSLMQAYRLCQKSVFIYIILRTLVADPPRFQSGDQWFEDLYRGWTQQRLGSDCTDDRFIADFVKLSEPMERTKTNLQKLISRHRSFCDHLQSRLGPGPLDEDDMFERSYLTELHDHSHMMLFPSCRAVMMLMATYQSQAEKDEHTVLLVLTGDNASMCSGPVTFNSIRQEAIPTGEEFDDIVICVRLSTAIAFMLAIERKEEACNGVMQSAIAGRQKTMLDLVARRVKVEAQQAVAYRVQGIALGGNVKGRYTGMHMEKEALYFSNYSANFLR